MDFAHGYHRQQEARDPYRNDGRWRHREPSPEPEHVGSGGNGHRQIQDTKRNLPKFPNNTELVCNETHTDLLEHLLPALIKYKCLHFSATPNKRRRSPWVRAFCDLHHPAGPWGSNKYSNTPDITSDRKYHFKSYKIPTLYKQLQQYDGCDDSEVHTQLRDALHDYYHKESWYKDFMQGCEAVAANEVNKPIGERVPIPTVENWTGPTLAYAAAANTTNRTAAAASTSHSENEGNTSTSAAAAATTRNHRHRKRVHEEENEKGDTNDEEGRCGDGETEEDDLGVDIRRITRSQKRRAEGSAAEASDASPNKKKKKPKMQAARVPVSPEPESADITASEKEEVNIMEEEEGDNDVKQEHQEQNNTMEDKTVMLQRKRKQLADLLDNRRKLNPGESHKEDRIVDKIQRSIDEIDDQLYELILAD